MKKNKFTKKLVCFIILLIILAFMSSILNVAANVEQVNQIAFIEKSVEDYETLKKILSEQMPVYIINNDNSISQITEILSEHINLESIHIYSKGKDGELKLGTNLINNDSINNYKEHLKNWSNSLTSGGDILFYACNAAKGIKGKQLIDKISKITGADVAASINFTGTYGMDTDWELEYSTGQISENKIDISKIAGNYHGKLDGTTRTWDGGGDDNNWNTAKNWSGDVVPDAYDVVVFNETSSKNVLATSAVGVYDFIVEENYDGQIRLGYGNHLTVNHNIQINGGDLDLGEVVLRGNDNNVDITGGTIEFYKIKIYCGQISITQSDGTVIDNVEVYRGSGDTTIINGGFKTKRANFKEAGHNYQLNGHIYVVGSQSDYLSFENSGNININDGALIDLGDCDYYYNRGTFIQNGTGKLVSAAKDFWFHDSSPHPITSSSVGENIFLTLTDYSANIDANTEETVTVTVKRESDPSDTAVLTLTETSRNSSKFTNNTGLTLVSTDAEPGQGQLRYASSENLIAEYVDSNDLEDTISCKMDRDPVIWDGGGNSDNWNTAANWSNDIVPKVFDVVLFNDTSVINVSRNNDLEISKIVVDEGYTGKIQINKTTVYNDLVIKDGIFTMSSDLTVNGGIDIQGGKFKNLYWTLNAYGDFSISGGETDIYRTRVMGSGNSITVTNMEEKVIDTIEIKENIDSTGSMEVGTVIIEQDKTFNVNGTLLCSESLTNNGTVNIADGAVLDLRSVHTFENNNTINDNDTGNVLYDAGGIGFVDAEGIPVGEADVGDVMHVEVIDLSQNKSVNLKEEVQAVVTSDVTGDTETILLIETGVDTGIFRSVAGLELIGTDAVPDAGQLKYNGSEDLIAVYADERDENDTVSCNLLKESVVWDGGGSDNNWSTPENWSIDKVPTRYDAITLNDTSTKNIAYDTNIEMYKLTIEESYTGQISSENQVGFYVSSDMIMSGGTVSLKGRLQTGGELIVNGGSLDISYNNYHEHNIIGGNLSVTGGEIFLSRGYIDVNGNISVVGGSFNTQQYSAYIIAYSDVELLTQTYIHSLDMEGSNLTCSIEGENNFVTLTIGEDVSITGTMNTTSINNRSKTTILGADTVITMEGQGRFYNYNNININDGAVFNLIDYNNYYNAGVITESNGGKFYSNVDDMRFYDSDGNGIVFAEVGEEIFVELTDANLNMDGSIKEEVTITVESVTTGDTEDINLIETSNNSGVFKNTIGLLLIADDLEPGEGELKYDGTEDLQVLYTDSTDENDSYILNLHRDPLIWDGGGDDNYWRTPENWSEDRVPDEFDRVVFNGTSSKDSNIVSNRTVLGITIEESYQGTVETRKYNSLTVNGDVLVEGGKILLDGEITVEGDLQLTGGIIRHKTWKKTGFNGDIIISGGTFYIDSHLYARTNFEMTGGKLYNEYYAMYIYGNTILTDTEEFTNQYLYIYGDNVTISQDKFSTKYLYIYTDGEVNFNGNMGLNEGKMMINSNSTLNLNGDIKFINESSNGFENCGVLNLKGNSILDIRNAASFINSGTITISDNASIYYNAEAMGVTDGNGAPALDDFNFGEDIIVSLIDPNMNIDSTQAESASVMLKNWTNTDEEIYELTETGVNSGEFRGLGFSTAVDSSATTGNDVFEGQDSDSFQILYTDFMSGKVEYVVSKNCAELNIEGIDDLTVEGIDYGNGDINGDMGMYTVTLQNKGDRPLGIIEVSLDNTEDFSLSDDLDTSDIQPDTSRDINVEFTPTSLGEKNANLTIKTNDYDEGDIVIPLKGIGVEPPISLGIEDITVLQGTENYIIDLFQIYEDNQDTDEELDYSVEYVSNNSLIQRSVIDEVYGSLTLGFDTSSYGSSDIRIRATDTSDSFVEDEFNITVSRAYTITGRITDSNDNPIEGVSITVIDYYDEDISFSGTTMSNGSFSISYPRYTMNARKRIKVFKEDFNEKIIEDYIYGDDDLGNIILESESEQEKVQRLTDNLTENSLGLQNEDTVDSVKYSLLLKDTAGEGSSITWSSSNQYAVSDSGEVTRPAYGNGDITVTMTATVSLNGYTSQKQFDVRVKEMSAGDVISIGSDSRYLTVSESAYQIPVVIDIVRIGDLEGIITVDYTTYDDTAEAGSDYDSSYGTLTFLSGESNKSVALSVYDDNQYEENEEFAFVISNPSENASIDVAEAKIVIADDEQISDADAVALDKEALRIVYAHGDTEDSVKNDITLPDSGMHETTIVWESDNTDVITDNGVVSRPNYTEGNAQVTVTANVYKGNASGTSSFNLIVVKMPKTDLECVQLDSQALNIRYSTGDSADNVTDNVILPTQGNNGSNISWSSDDTLIGISGDVTRPSYNQGDRQVTLVARISKGEITVTREFILTVKARPEETDDDSDDDRTHKQDKGDYVQVSVGPMERNHEVEVTTSSKGKKKTLVNLVDETITKRLETLTNKPKEERVVKVSAKNNSNTLVCGLNGKMVKDMELKDVAIKIETDQAAYNLPAQQINIDAVAEQIGADINLEDIKVNIEISKPSDDMVKVIENSAQKGHFSLVVEPVDFKVTCTSNDKIVEVSKFKSYIERTIAIPEGVDPEKITTGIILNPDGTFYHVPTQIVVIDGKYHAKINSLTNSTYSVVWNEEKFKDIDGHWAKEVIEDMGSRMIVDGIGGGKFVPDNDITRGEFASIIVKALGLMKNNAGKKIFIDVTEDKWYYDVITMAHEYDLVRGYENGKFNPGDMITRQEAMVVIERAMKLAGMNTEIDERDEDYYIDSFKDKGNIAQWARQSSSICIKYGIFTGYNNKLNLDDNISRAQTTAITQRLLQKAGLIN